MTDASPVMMMATMSMGTGGCAIEMFMSIEGDADDALRGRSQGDSAVLDSMIRRDRRDAGMTAGMS